MLAVPTFAPVGDFVAGAAKQWIGTIRRQVARSAQRPNGADRRASRKKKSPAATLLTAKALPRSAQFGKQQRLNVSRQDAPHDQFRPEDNWWRADQIVRKGYKLKIVIEMIDQPAMKRPTPRSRTALPVRTDPTQIPTTFIAKEDVRTEIEALCPPLQTPSYAMRESGPRSMPRPFVTKWSASLGTGLDVVREPISAIRWTVNLLSTLTRRLFGVQKGHAD
jgi:hypothetical protein